MTQTCRVVQLLLGQNQVYQWRVVCKVAKGKKTTKVQHCRNTERAVAAKIMFMLVTNERVKNGWNFSNRKRQAGIRVKIREDKCVRKIYKSRNGLQLKGKKSRLDKVVYSKEYISSVHGKIGQREKGSGNRTIIEQRGISGLSQVEEEQVQDCRKKRRKKL